MALTCKTIRECVVQHQKSEKMQFHRYDQGKETFRSLKDCPHLKKISLNMQPINL